MSTVPEGSATCARIQIRLVGAEYLKIRTTRAWRLFVGGFTLLSVLTVAFGWLGDNNVLHPPLSDYPAGAGRDAVLAHAASARPASGAAGLAADMLTSGQFLLVLVTLLLGVHVATGEYGAGTMTATFLAEPRRSRVVWAKVWVSCLFGAAFWAVQTGLHAAATPLFLAEEHLPASALSSPTAARAVVRGMLAFVLWALFGLGLGAVLRDQVAAVVAAIAVYAGGFVVVETLIHLLHDAFHAPWLLSLAVLAPAQASNAMTAAGKAFQDAPPWWVGALVLAGYGLVLAAFGAQSIGRSDVV